ncbi:sulfotransferase 1C2-like [Apostichopus japonicus]|uniref:sulfotransferase 1C2-like n=1 Tax=Stichopus japonicus TaxID=307972 RepID=UPI003AB90ADC
MAASALPDHILSDVKVHQKSVLPITILDEYLKDIKKMVIRSSDVIIVTWPKSGTTWLQFIVSQIFRGQESDEMVPFFEEHFFLEMAQNFPSSDVGEGVYKIAVDAPSPRFLKSHLLLKFLPEELTTKKPKVIYVARNPKDAAVSFFHFAEMIKTLPDFSSWNEFFDLFCKGLIPYGDWFEHVLPFWELRDEPNVLFLKYEGLKQDLKKSVAQISTFLEKPITEDQLDDICKGSTFQKMKENPKANPDLLDWTAGKDWKKPTGKHIQFLRKGQVGDWKNLFTVAQSERFDEIYNDKLKGTGLTFQFE